ncbi:MAG: STAS domain-containing protein [Actinomycetota bacterium]
MDAFLVDLASIDGCQVVRFVGELDLVAAERAERVSDGALTAGSGPLVLDLSELTYCDSCGIRVLLGLRAKAASAGRTVVLRRPHPLVRRVLEMTSVLELFVVEGDLVPPTPAA